MGSLVSILHPILNTDIVTHAAYNSPQDLFVQCSAIRTLAEQVFSAISHCLSVSYARLLQFGFWSDFTAQNH